MNGFGLILGGTTFLLIGLFHPIVIWCEYYFSKRIWPVFLLVGLAALGASLCVAESLPSGLLAVFGISCLWSIKELFEQEKRVEKGWFPRNPKRARERTEQNEA